jgi:hypothetical protein
MNAAATPLANIRTRTADALFRSIAAGDSHAAPIPAPAVTVRDGFAFDHRDFTPGPRAPKDY